MIFHAFLIAVFVAASANEFKDPENCVANATNSEDSAANGSPLIQKALNRKAHERNGGHESPPVFFEGFVIDESANRGHWESVWDSNVGGLTMLDPVRPDDHMLNDSFNDGTIDRQYKSYYMPVGPGLGEKKFYHEVGVTLAHRKAWQALIDRSLVGGGQWGLIFEGDATLRADFWRWMRHLKDVLRKGDAPNPFMIWLGHCYDFCYSRTDPQWRDGDVCFNGDEANNPHNVTGCMLHYTQGICPTAYLISVEGAKSMIEATAPMNCALDEKIRYEIQKNNWDARIICQQLVSQPWQNDLYWPFDTFRKQEEKKQRKGYLNLQNIQEKRWQARDESFCDPPGPLVKTILSWPPPE